MKSPITIYYVHDESTKPYRDSILKVLNKLPGDFADRIVENVVIIIEGGDFATYFNFDDAIKNIYPSTNVAIKEIKHIIVINVTQMELFQVELKQREHIIAHEFAHYILGHKQLTKEEQKILYKDFDEKADELATEWGFPPCQKNYFDKKEYM